MKNKQLFKMFEEYAEELDKIRHQDFNLMGVTPKDAGAIGWAAEVDEVYSNSYYAVLIRTVQTAWGPIRHAAIRNAHGEDIPWREKQWIKNKIFGEEAKALEVFPKDSELVDAAPMYHLWILPECFELPFNLYYEK